MNTFCFISYFHDGAQSKIRYLSHNYPIGIKLEFAILRVITPCRVYSTRSAVFRNVDKKFSKIEPRLGCVPARNHRARAQQVRALLHRSGIESRMEIEQRSRGGGGGEDREAKETFSLSTEVGIAFRWRLHARDAKRAAVACAPIDAHSAA